MNPDSLHNLIRILVPVYNGGKYVEPFLNAIPDGYTSLLTFVDDGSEDDTRKKLQAHNVHVLAHENNRGKGAALLTGFNFAANHEYKAILTIDIDLQHPPNVIPDLLELFWKNYTNRAIILGNRWNRKSMPIQRQVSNFLTSLLLTVRTNMIIRDSQCGFRIIPIEVIRQLEIKNTGFQMESELLIKATLNGTKITHFPIHTIYDHQTSAMQPILDTVRFTRLWLGSFFW